MRIGHGFDVHRLEDGNSLGYIKLGGVKIPFDRHLIAHSDGDVVIHALCDAILGAAALGDIGVHFPDTDNQYAGVDSMLLLKNVMNLITIEGWKVGNVDITVIAERPKLSKFHLAIRESLSEATNLDLNAINVKATTTEGLGYTGRNEGIAVHVVTLLDSYV